MWCHVLPRWRTGDAFWCYKRKSTNLRRIWKSGSCYFWIIAWPETCKVCHESLQLTLVFHDNSLIWTWLCQMSCSILRRSLLCSVWIINELIYNRCWISFRHVNLLQRTLVHTCEESLLSSFWCWIVWELSSRPVIFLMSNMYSQSKLYTSKYEMFSYKKLRRECLDKYKSNINQHRISSNTMTAWCKKFMTFWNLTDIACIVNEINFLSFS